MHHNKAEGKIAGTTSGNVALENEGGFDVGVDDQISNIEEQLKRAQNTLLDLQNLKGKLEIERKRDLEKAREAQERLDAKELKAENAELKSELKNYHTEINSLKSIISSLKKDLVETTQSFQTKVADSLKILEEAESKIDNKRSGEHKNHHQGDDIAKADIQEENNSQSKDDHEKPTKEIAQDDPVNEKTVTSLAEEKQDEKMASVIEKMASQVTLSDPAKPEQKIEQTPTSDPANKEKPEEIKVEPQPEVKTEAPAPVTESKPEQPAVEEVKEPEKAVVEEPAGQSPMGGAKTVTEEKKEEVKEPEKIEAPEKPAEQSPPAEAKIEEKPEEVKAEPVANQETPPEETTLLDENQIANEELSEYEKIKMELEALERGEIPQSQSPAQSPAQPQAQAQQPVTSPTVDNQPSTGSTPPKIEWNGNDPFGKKGEKKSALGKMFGFLKKKKPQDKVANAVENKDPNTAQPQPTTPPEPEKAVAETEKQPEPAQEQKTEPEKVQPAAQESKPEEPKKSEENKKEDKDNKGGAGKLVVKTAVVVLVVVSAYFTYQIKNADTLRNTYVTQAKQNHSAATNSQDNIDTPDQSINKPPEEKYKEAFADLPFESSLWQDFTSSDLGIKFSYPVNTSHKLQPIGSNNIWILRKEGYLMQVEKIETSANLQDYINSYKPPIVYNVQATKFKEKIAISLVPEDDLPIKGNIYLVQGKGFILKIWYKTFKPGENPDDEKRVQKMIDSFAFTQ